MKEKLDSEKILSKIIGKRNELKKTGAKKIGLFGSFLKGRQKEDSDIDFLVEFEKIDFEGYYSLIKILENLFSREIDLVIEDDLKPELKHIMREAVYVEI